MSHSHTHRILPLRLVLPGRWGFFVHLLPGLRQAPGGQGCVQAALPACQGKMHGQLGPTQDGSRQGQRSQRAVGLILASVCLPPLDPRLGMSPVGRGRVRSTHGASGKERAPGAPGLPRGLPGGGSSGTQPCAPDENQTQALGV